ncbi:Dual specificity protein phosphatase 19 [Gigaspora margarita]|uniref:Dual specificity protein phosphatase 19 n=1 Tax=Gigaspora margarita TaxID=4874 RepID=A0A8H4A701_GIGMA|nr:Dual specificity protein phosphatase 19 [Gigaspora margarita]
MSSDNLYFRETDEDVALFQSFKKLTSRYSSDGSAEEILPRLYLGSKRAALNHDWLKQHKITNILTVAHDIKPRFPKSYVYKVIPIEDSIYVNISKYFEETFLFIQNVLDQEDKSILVHCQMGISRSSSIVIAYIMKSQNKSLKDAMALVQEKRPHVWPNASFYKQLEEFESKISVNNNSDSESNLKNEIGKKFVIDE